MSMPKSIVLTNQLYVMVGLTLVGAVVAGMALQALTSPLSSILAEQVGSSPDSGTSSRLVQAHDSVLDQGHGASAVPQWTEDWGEKWNRIMAAASWVPQQTGETWPTQQGFDGLSRVLQSGTLYGGLQNNRHSNATTFLAGYGVWTETANGGSPASVTANSATATLESNQVMRDGRTGLWWTDSTNAEVHNSFVWTTGDDGANPAGKSCNFTSAGNANTWCNVSDYTGYDGYEINLWSGWANPAALAAPDTAKTGVSAQEFCLNLVLDDGTGVKTDWRVPTQREILLGFLNGAGFYLSNTNRDFWISTQSHHSPHYSFDMHLVESGMYLVEKWHYKYARCIRG